MVRLVEIHRYPVKSLAGEAIERADVGWHGLDGDRRWAYLRADAERDSFPWFTLRERADLGQHVPRLVGEDEVVVRTPDGREVDVVALGHELGVRTLRLSSGCFDTLPISLVSSASIAALGASVGAELSPARFRPNLVVEGGAAYFEDDLVGRTIRIGATVRVRIDKRDQRCVITNLDPRTNAKDPRVLKTLGRERDACFGVYGTVVATGAIAVGDALVVE